MNLGKIIKLLSFIAILITILLTTGCSKQNRELIINNFNSRTPEFSQTQDNVTLEVKKLTKNEFHEIFPGSKYKKRTCFRKNNIIKISIDNQNSNNIFLNKNSVLTPSVNIKTHDQLNHDIKKPEKSVVYATTILGTIAAVPLAIFTTIGSMLIPASFAVDPGSAVAASGLNKAFSTILLGALILTPVIILTSFFIGRSIYKRHKKNNLELKKFLDHNILNLSINNEIKPNTKFDKYLITKKEKTQPSLIFKLFKSINNSEKEYLEFTAPNIWS
ncbi:hypothetical protein KJ644_00045 [Candidatus Dependentiae bacterium]|nr:hypothetical protein [Candidatus Dependentiae bacterium]MBU4386849.1 hypothetical protein [Candidatus Dependentiae bacterium]MCG2756319.1 hypothetical protein [Candidatus Dependentiae bacterium]